MAPQDIHIGTLTSHRLFVSLIGDNRSAPKLNIDGLLMTGIFRSVYISYADRFVVLEPW